MRPLRRERSFAPCFEFPIRLSMRNCQPPQEPNIFYPWRSITLGIDFVYNSSMTQSIESYAKKLNAYCVRCGRPHPSAIGFDGKKPCTQGINCATVFTANGERGYAGYGSGFDTNQFYGVEPHREALAGTDPLCDACLGELMLAGAIFDMGEPREWGARLELPSTPHEVQALARNGLAQYFKEIINWRSDSV